MNASLPIRTSCFLIMSWHLFALAASASGQSAASPTLAASAAPTEVSTSSDGSASDLNLAHYFERHARALPEDPQWSWSWDLPVALLERAGIDGGYLLTSPGRRNSGDLLRFSLLAAVTGGAFGADRQIDIESRVRHPRSSREGDVEDAIQNFGVANGIAPVLGGVLAVGLFEHCVDAHLELFASHAGAESIATDAEHLLWDTSEALLFSSAVFTPSLKETFGRDRPNAAKGPFHFHPFSGAASFPSGHTTGAFTVAAAFAEHFDNNLWVAIPAYALAGGVGFARTRANAHFASDVVVGAAIGTATGRTVVNLRRLRAAHSDDQSSGPTIEIAPAVSSDLRGVQFVLRF